MSAEKPRSWSLKGSLSFCRDLSSLVKPLVSPQNQTSVLQNEPPATGLGGCWEGGFNPPKKLRTRKTSRRPEPLALLLYPPAHRPVSWDAALFHGLTPLGLTPPSVLGAEQDEVGADVGPIALPECQVARTPHRRHLALPPQENRPLH